MGGYVYHVLNRAVGRGTLFRNEGDFAAFERVLEETRNQIPMRVLCFCVMPNLWHLVLWPEHDGDLSEYLRWLTVTHTQRWLAAHHTSGTGPLYQGRFKSFPMHDDHLLTVCRYVERNALRANLTFQAEDWRWGSLWQRRRQVHSVTLADAWPVPSPRRWTAFVNQPETEAELQALRRSVVRGTPFGEDRWQQATAKTLGLGSTLRGWGRPRKFPG